ncbi:MAG: hypothetical protein ACK55S_16765, partial [Planctomycetota bacterium]
MHKKSPRHKKSPSQNGQGLQLLDRKFSIAIDRIQLGSRRYSPLNSAGLFTVILFHLGLCSFLQSIQPIAIGDE